jgi:hypothetical protein
MVYGAPLGGGRIRVAFWEDPMGSVRRKLLRAAIMLGGMLIVVRPAIAVDTAPIAIAVIDLDYVDTSGEPRDQRQEHAARIARFSDALRGDLARGGKFRIVTPQCDPAPCTSATPSPELVARAREAGARLVLVGGVHKQSTLIQWAKVQAIDVETERVVLDKLLTFRGDTDEAWDRAEAFLAREMTGLALAP